jgi:polyhydroxybutyrate depolymerase
MQRRGMLMRRFMRRALLSEERQLHHQGLQRKYLLHTPATYRPDYPLSLVIGLHGGYTSPSRFALTTGFNDLADSEAFLVAYPEGCDRHWNDGRIGVNTDIDDVGFIAALIADIQRHRAVDTQRVYAVGISNGGYMVQRLASELPNTFAAFASVAAALPVPLRVKMQANTSVSLLMINSRRDKFVPFQGGVSRRGKGGEILSIPDTFEYWRQKSNCHREAAWDLTSSSQFFRGQTGEIEVTRYVNQEGGAEVVLIVLANGGHTWPGGFQQPRWLVGETSQDIDASQLIWAFFQGHRLVATANAHG